MAYTWVCRGIMDFCCVLVLFLCLQFNPVRSQDNAWIKAEYSIVEETPPNEFVGNLSAHPHFRSQPLPASGSRQFRFLAQNSQFQQLFTIDGQGVLRTNTVIDRDDSCARSMKCDMKLDVAVVGPDRMFQLMKITVNVEDINDNAPTFSSASFSGDTYQLSISETALPGVSFVLPQAWDPDSGKYGVQTYRLATPTDKFSLNVSLGAGGTVDIRLVLRARLDREERASYALEVVATDGGTPALIGKLTVDVQVRDANDNSPTFEQPLYEVRVREDTSVGDVILRARATDEDAGPNGEVVYSLTSPTPNANPGLLVFAIRNTTGEVVLQRRLDYEVQTAYHLQVTAKDRGPDAIPTQARVVILVEDVNDHSPSILVNALTESGNVEIPENTEPGEFVAHVSVEDQDSGPSGDVACVLSSGPFELRELLSNVYKVIAMSSFDTERQSSYVLTLACHDNGVPPLRTSRDIYVKILDENDHSPRFTQDVYSATLRENTTVGAFVVQVNASDEDSGDNARITYTLEGDPTRAFRVDPDSGVVSANRLLDYETMHKARFRVVAVDHGEQPQSSTAAVVVNVVDVNDEAPRFYLSSYSFSLEEHSPVNTEIGAVMATDKDSEPFNDIVYTLSSNEPDSEPFDIDSKLGLITTRRILDREYKPSYTLTIYAGNPGYPRMTSSVQVTILITDTNDNAPTIVFPNNTSNTVNIPYGAPEGYIFTKIIATDVDAGANAKLNYAIAKSSADGLFDIDESSGAVSIKSSDLWTSGDMFEVLVTVSDQGTPPKTSSIDMIIVVNKSIIYPGRKDLYPGVGDGSLERNSGVGAGSLNQNQTVLISLGIVTLLLVTILIVAIILVRRRKYKEDDEDSTSADGGRNQNNFSKVQPSVKAGGGDYIDTDTLPESDSQESGVYLEDSGERGPKDVKFINNISGGILVKGGPQVTAVSTKVLPDDNGRGYSLSVPATQENTWPPAQHYDHPHPYQHPPQYHHAEPPCRPLADHAGTAQQKAWALTQQELEAHQLLSRQHGQAEVSDSDSTSGCSAEVSTTDSGRGPSEDGDHLAPPGVSMENRHSDMTHQGTADLQTDARGRTPGRGTRSGTRPPTGIKPQPHGVRDGHLQKQTTIHSKHRGRHPHGSAHMAPSSGGASNNTGKALPPGPTRTALPPNHMTSSGPHAHAHGQHSHWAVPSASGGEAETRLAVLDQPTAPRAGSKVNSNHHHAPYRETPGRGRAGHASAADADAASGKMLIWERFREHAGCGRELPVGVSSRTLGSVHETATTQDEMSDDASTTSGSYVLDLDDVRHHPRPIIVGERDSFV